MTDAVEEIVSPPPVVRLTHVRKLRDIRRALLRVTNAVLAGHIEVAVGNHAVYSLSTVGKIMESEVLSDRIDALEAAVVAEQPKGLRLVGRG